MPKVLQRLGDAAVGCRDVGVLCLCKFYRVNQRSAGVRSLDLGGTLFLRSGGLGLTPLAGVVVGLPRVELLLALGSRAVRDAERVAHAGQPRGSLVREQETQLLLAELLLHLCHGAAVGERFLDLLGDAALVGVFARRLGSGGGRSGRLYTSGGCTFLGGGRGFLPVLDFFSGLGLRLIFGLTLLSLGFFICSNLFLGYRLGDAPFRFRSFSTLGLGLGLGLGARKLRLDEPALPRFTGRSITVRVDLRTATALGGILAFGICLIERDGARFGVGCLFSGLGLSRFVVGLGLSEGGRSGSGGRLL